MDWILSHHLTVACLTVAGTVATAWMAARLQRPRALLAPLAVVLCGVALAVTGWMVDTPAESGEYAVQAMIARAVDADPAGAGAWFEPGAVIHFGGFDQPSMPRREIDRDLRSLQDRHRVEHHATLLLRGRTVSAEVAEVDATCLTRTRSSPTGVLTAWSFRLRRQSDGSWRIQALSFDRLAGSTPRAGIF